MLNSIFQETISNISLESVLLCIGVSLILGTMIALCHKVSSSYSKNFLITITILPLIVGIIIIMVNGNLGTSVAIVGAFSLVRFRSMPGTSREILSVFFAMAVGLSIGIGHLTFATVITIAGCLAILLFSKIKIFDRNKSDKILKITIPEDLDYPHVFDETFKKYTKSYYLEQTKTTNMGSLFDLSYKITLKDKVNEKDFIDELRIKNGNLKIIITHPLESNDL